MDDEPEIAGRDADRSGEDVSRELKDAVEAMGEEMRKRVGLDGSLKIILNRGPPFMGFGTQPPFARLVGTLRQGSDLQCIELQAYGPKGHFVWTLRRRLMLMTMPCGPLYEWDGMKGDDVMIQKARDVIGEDMAKELEAIAEEFGLLFRSLDVWIIPRRTFERLLAECAVRK